MAPDSFKDLKVGDQVEFYDIPYMNDRISGKGEVFGFGKICMTNVVWICVDNGQLYGVAYGDVKKL